MFDRVQSLYAPQTYQLSRRSPAQLSPARRLTQDHEIEMAKLLGGGDHLDPGDLATGDCEMEDMEALWRRNRWHHRDNQKQ